MIISIHQPRYWPWLGFLDKVAKSDIFVILDNVKYNSDSYQSRCQIRNKEGWDWMSVPVYTSGRSGQLINEVEIVNNQWAQKHWMMIKSNYGRTNYFKKYKEKIEKIYNGSWDKLVDLNMETIELLLEEFNIDTQIIYASDLKVNGSKTDLLVGICKKLGGKIYLSGQGAKDYLEVYKFDEVGIEVKWQNFKHPEYQQRWEGFEEGMSGLDLLLNYGDQADEILFTGDLNGKI